MLNNPLSVLRDCYLPSIPIYTLFLIPLVLLLRVSTNMALEIIFWLYITGTSGWHQFWKKKGSNCYLLNNGLMPYLKMCRCPVWCAAWDITPDSCQVFLWCRIQVLRFHNQYIGLVWFSDPDCRIFVALIVIQNNSKICVFSIIKKQLSNEKNFIATLSIRLGGNKSF